MIEWLICWFVDWLIGWLIDWLSDWLIYRLIDWLIDWLIGWLVDWLTDQLIYLFIWLTDWLIEVSESVIDCRCWPIVIWILLATAFRYINSHHFPWKSSYPSHAKSIIHIDSGGESETSITENAKLKSDFLLVRS